MQFQIEWDQGNTSISLSSLPAANTQYCDEPSSAYMDTHMIMNFSHKSESSHCLTQAGIFDFHPCMQYISLLILGLF